MSSRGRFSYDVVNSIRKDNRERDVKNTIIHPMQRNFAGIVKTQTAFKLRVAAAKGDLGKYKNGSDIPGARLNLGDMYHDIKDGKASPAIMAAFEMFKANKAMLDEVARPNTVLRGVELSPAGRPMRRDNHCVDSIAEIPPSEVVVSRDVYQQLTQEQANVLNLHVGIHEYCKVQTGKVSLKNPTGEWPVVHKEETPFVHVERGATVDRAYSFNVKVEVNTKKLIPEPLEFRSPHAFEALGFPLGTSIRVDHEGVTPGDPGAPMLPTKWRSQLSRFRFADPVGRHLDDIEVRGEVRKKYDGVFHHAEITKGQIIITARNGVRYFGDVDVCDLEFAFELDDYHAKVIYVRRLGNNPVPLYGPVQDFLCRNLALDIGGELRAVTDDHDWKFDGYVIRNNVGHFFLKDKKTVDITMIQAETLRQEGYSVAEFGDQEKPWTIYELTIEKGGLTNPVPRLRNGKCDKVLPNHLKRVEFALVSPTWKEYKKYHNISM